MVIWSPRSLAVQGHASSASVAARSCGTRHSLAALVGGAVFAIKVDANDVAKVELAVPVGNLAAKSGGGNDLPTTAPPPTHVPV